MLYDARKVQDEENDKGKQGNPKSKRRNADVGWDAVTGG
jgi:hypothetical protein